MRPELDFVPKTSGMSPLKGLEMDCQRAGRDLGRFLGDVQQHWAGRDLGRFLGDVQQHWAGMGTRVGLCIEEAKGRLVRNVSKFEIRKPAIGNNWPTREVRGVAQSFFAGLLGWRNDIEHMGEKSVEFRVPACQQHLFASLSTSRGISSQWDPKPLFQLAMSADQVSRRLDGVPVYTVSNSANEFILISDMNSQKSLGIFCFRQEDAESLLSQVRDREPSLGRGARVVAVSLDKVYQLNTEGIAFRFLPDPRQVKNALDAKVKSGETRKAFDGVPVFQSDNLIIRSSNRRFCPIFFCKEDLERALSRAFKQQQRVNPSLKVSSDIQVGSFEDVLKRMEKNEEETGWGDIVFIPPGMDAFSHLGKTVAQGSGRESVVA